MFTKKNFFFFSFLFSFYLTTCFCFNVEEVRAKFPFVSTTMHNRAFIYFDSAASSQKPKEVVESICSFCLQEYSNVHRSNYEKSHAASEKFEATRSAIRKFINATYDEEIIFTKGATDSVNLAASSFGKSTINEGDEIIVSEMEHHSNIVPWQMLAKEKKASIKILPISKDGCIDLKTLDGLLGEKVKIVAISHVSNVTGVINPIEEVIKLSHAKGAKVIIDGAQAAGHMAIDVQKLDCDFYLFSAHKAYGPNGVGILYGKKELLEEMPPFCGGGEMVESVSKKDFQPQPLPFKFEAGTPAIAEIIAFKKAIDFINGLGIRNIEDWESKLTQYATQKLTEIQGLKIIGPISLPKGPIISFIVDDLCPNDIGMLLDLKGIAIRTGCHCAQPLMEKLNLPGTCRLSFAVYNTTKEIDIFVEALKEVISVLRQEKN